MRDFTGKKFGKVTVLDFHQKIKSRNYWNVECECGNKKVVRDDMLEKLKSCGCLRKESQFKVKHGLSHTPFYRIWDGMIKRCTNKNHDNYHRYGGAGITVCEEWKIFEGFMKDMYSSYKEGLSIDRKDNSKGYSKENCRWVTTQDQVNNRTNTTFVIYRGEEIALSDACRLAGINYGTVRSRLNLGWDIEKALNEPTDFTKRRKKVGNNF